MISGGGKSILAACVLAISGFVLIGDSIWIHAKAQLAQLLIQKAWSEERAQAKPWPWADTWPVAKLSADALENPLYVLAGAQGHALAFGPGHVGGSALPGEGGISVVAGHRDTHFQFLRDLEPGDRLLVESPNGRDTSYAVESMLIVDVRDQTLDELLALEVGSKLVLITCYPFDALIAGGTQRFVVIAAADIKQSARKP